MLEYYMQKNIKYVFIRTKIIKKGIAINMKILNLRVNHFGKLADKEIELKDGINVIYGKNESGKSTLLKFIMGMFYGLSKNKNGKFISDYERYTPWDGGDFSGKISYELDDGQKYEVFREFKKKNPTIYNEDLEDISNHFNIDKTAGNKFFYDQTKVDEELFLSTIVSLQEEVKLNEKEQNTLVQKMSNLASTGEDNVSFQKIMTKLNKKQMEEIGTQRSQDRPINVITKRMEEIQNEKEFLSKFSTKQYEIEVTKSKFKGLYGSGIIEGQKVILLKPQTYMNLSGESVKEVVDFYNIEPEKIIIIYDDMDIEPEIIKIRKMGGAGGHNGMKSVIQHLNTQKFTRIRVGIGTPKNKEDSINYVIGAINKEDEEKLDKATTKAKEAIIEIIKNGVDKAMNKFN